MKTVQENYDELTEILERYERADPGSQEEADIWQEYQDKLAEVNSEVES